MKKYMNAMIGGLLVVCFAGNVLAAAALTAARDTKGRSGDKINIGVTTNTIIYAGALVAISNGYALPAADVAGYTVIGRASETVDNRTAADGAGTDGALTIDVERGIYGWTAYNLTDANIGDLVYVYNDNSVSNGTVNSIIAGVLVDYSDSLAWVDSFDVPRSAGSFTTLAASGASTLTGAVAMDGGVTCDTTKFTIANTSGNTYIDGTLVVNGALTGSNSVTVGSTVGRTYIGSTAINVGPAITATYSNSVVVASNLNVSGTCTLATLEGTNGAAKWVRLPTTTNDHTAAGTVWVSNGVLSVIGY